MIRHTNDPEERAASIAYREAEEIWRETRSFNKWLKVWFSTYRQALRELMGYMSPGKEN